MPDIGGTHYDDALWASAERAVSHALAEARHEHNASKNAGIGEVTMYVPESVFTDYVRRVYNARIAGEKEIVL
jgi:hypothetical protein